MKLLFVINVPGDMRHGAGRSFGFVGRELEKMGHEVEYVYAEQLRTKRYISLDTLRALDDPLRALAVVRQRLKEGDRWDVIKMNANLSLSYNLWRQFRCASKRLPPAVSMTFGIVERYRRVEAEEIAMGAYDPQYSWRHTMLGWPVRCKVVEYGLRTSDHCVCVNTDDRDFLIHRYNVDESRVTFIPVGVAEEFFFQRSYKNNGQRILFVGTWWWRKGVKYLRDAFLQVLQRFPHCSLSLVGTFCDRSRILKEFPEHAWSHIRVVESISGDEIVREYQNHDIFILPSLFEGMPLTIAEAMAAGLPVVSTTVCGMNDLIKHGQDGILVPPRDVNALAEALIRLLSDACLRQRLGQAAQEKVRNYTWRQIALKFMEVFELCQQKALQ